MWLNIWIMDSCSFLIFLNSFNEDLWSLLSFSLFFVCFFPLFWGFLNSCSIVPCCQNSETCLFRFSASKECISQSPFGILHTVCSSGKDLARKLLLFRLLSVCLPVSSMLKLRLAEFFFYRTSPFFPWNVGIQSNCCNTLPVLLYLFGVFQWHFPQKRKLDFWRTIYESLGINYPKHFSGPPARFGDHFFADDRHIKEALDQVFGQQNLYRLPYLNLSQ